MNKDTKKNPNTKTKAKVSKNKSKISNSSDFQPVSENLGAISDTDIVSIEKRQQTFETVSQMILSVVSMYVSRIVFKLDFKSTIIRRACRLIFCGYIAFLQLLNLYINRRINFAKDNSIIVEAESNNLAALQTLGSLGSLFGAPKAKVPVTTQQYDLKEAAKLFGGILPELLIMVVVNMIFGKGFILLLLLPMMGITNILKSPIVKIHLFGFHPVGVLKRPFATQWDAMFAAANEKVRQAQTAAQQQAGTEKGPQLEEEEEEVPTSGVKLGDNNRAASVPTVEENPVEADFQDSSSADPIDDSNQDDSADDDDDDSDDNGGIAPRAEEEEDRTPVDEDISEEDTTNESDTAAAAAEEETIEEYDGEEGDDDVDSILDQLDAVVPSQDQDSGDDDAVEEEGVDQDEDDSLEQLIDELDVDSHQ